MALSPSITDLELVSRIRENDDAAFDELFRRHYADLCRTAIRFVRDEAQSEDLIQELFFSLWQRRAKLPEDLTAVGGYLHRSARNRCLNFLRDQNRIPVDDGELPLNAPAVGLPSDDLEQDDLKNRLHRAIDRLPERCRLVFTMSKVDEMSRKEVADALGISPKTVENQMTRAYRFLREWLSLFLLLSGSFW